MDFEFDLRKSASNKQKHGIDFFEAQAMWKGRIEWLDSRYFAEQRFLVLGKIDDKFWTAVITIRDGKIRIISVRRSRRSERKIYEKEKGKDDIRRRI